MGLVAPRTVIQIDDLDSETRLLLWNTLHRFVAAIEEKRTYGSRDVVSLVAKYLWRNDLGRAADEYRSHSATLQMVKYRILAEEWSLALEILESFGKACAVAFDQTIAPKSYQDLMNEKFSSCLVGYRFVAGELIRVTEPAEVGEIEDAIAAGGASATHVERALQLLSNREAPQYANVVHESIHAVESKIAALTGKKVLSDGLKALEAAGYPIHPALAGGWTKLYGYTSDAGGIRHGLIRDEEIDEPLAVYFLVSCSAFVNLLSKVEGARK